MSKIDFKKASNLLDWFAQTMKPHQRQPLQSQSLPDYEDPWSLWVHEDPLGPLWILIVHEDPWMLFWWFKPDFRSLDL